MAVRSVRKTLRFTPSEARLIEYVAKEFTNGDFTKYARNAIMAQLEKDKAKLKELL